MILLLLLILVIVFLLVLLSSSSSVSSRGNYSQAPLMYGSNGYYLPPETVGYIITSNSLNNSGPYFGTVTVTYWVNPGINDTWSTNPANPPYIVKFYPTFGAMVSIFPNGGVTSSIDAEPYPSCNDFQCGAQPCQCYVFAGQSNGWGYPYFQVTYNASNYTPDGFAVGSDQVAEYIAQNGLVQLTTIISNGSDPQTYGFPNVIAPVPWSPSLDLF